MTQKFWICLILSTAAVLCFNVEAASPRALQDFGDEDEDLLFEEIDRLDDEDEVQELLNMFDGRGAAPVTVTNELADLALTWEDEIDRGTFYKDELYRDRYDRQVRGRLTWTAVNGTVTLMPIKPNADQDATVDNWQKKYSIDDPFDKGEVSGKLNITLHSTQSPLAEEFEKERLRRERLATAQHPSTLSTSSTPSTRSPSPPSPPTTSPPYTTSTHPPYRAPPRRRPTQSVPTTRPAQSTRRPSTTASPTTDESDEPDEPYSLTKRLEEMRKAFAQWRLW